MTWPMPWRLLGIAALVVATLFGIHLLDESRQDIGFQRARSEDLLKESREAEDASNAALAADVTARLKERALQETTDKAVNEATIRETKQRVAADSLRRERDGLLGDLATSRSAISSASDTSVRARVTALTEVFGECTAEVEFLAGEADRHASDSLMYQEAWPK